MKTHTGKVRWFDNLSGEGMIREANGNSIYIHWSAIADKPIQHNSNKTEWYVLFPGQMVEYSVYSNSYHRQVEKIMKVDKPSQMGYY